jgi:hypothetical protein
MTTQTIDTATRARKVEHVVAGQPTSDGAGVKLTRVLTQHLHRGLPGPSASRLRDGDLHDRGPHAPSRQRGP